MINNKKRPPKKLLSSLLKKEWLQFIITAVLILSTLLLFYRLSSKLITDQEGIDFFIVQGLHFIIICCISWIMMRLFRIVLTHYFKTKTQTPVPRYMLSLFNWGITIGAILCITTMVFNQSPWSLVTAGGIVGAGLAFSLQGIVLDMVSGLILDVEHTYEIGDWIRLDDNTIGEITQTSWRHIEVRTEYSSSIIIPNRKLTSAVYENLSHFNKVYGDEISVALGHDVPIDRAERVLIDALLSIPEVVKTGIHHVWAEGINQGGVMYTLRFGVQGFDLLRERRHQVLKAATSTLHANGMTFSKAIREYAKELPIQDVLRRVKLFDALTDTEIKALSKEAERFLIEPGDDIMVAGDKSDSLFVIAEGVVDVLVPLAKKKSTSHKIVATLGSGNFVGDRALLLGETRSATVRAQTQVLTYEVKKADFSPLLKARPEIIEALSESVLEREQDTSRQITDAKKIRKKQETLKDELIKGIRKFFGI